MIDQKQRQTDKMVIMAFPAFTGGKFIMNCLSLSRHCVPQSTQCARYLVQQPTDYDYRLRMVCSTLPPPSDMQNWRSKWEFGDTDFFQGSTAQRLDQWYHNQPTEVDSLLRHLIDLDRCFFMTSHGGWADVKSIIKVWPNSRIILLTNCAEFWSLAIRLKQSKNTDQSYCFSDCAGNECQERYDLLRGPDWPDWHVFESHNYDIDKVSKHVTINADIRNEIKQYYGWHENTNNLFCFDVDNNYFHRSNFFATMEQLYAWIGFDDFNPELIDQYYTKYISLHEDKHGQTI